MSISSLLWTNVQRHSSRQKAAGEYGMWSSLNAVRAVWNFASWVWQGGKKKRNLKCCFGFVLYQLYTHSIFTGQRNLFAAVVFLRLKQFLKKVFALSCLLDRNSTASRRWDSLRTSWWPGLINQVVKYCDGGDQNLSCRCSSVPMVN